VAKHQRSHRLSRRRARTKRAAPASLVSASAADPFGSVSLHSAQKAGNVSLHTSKTSVVASCEFTASAAGCSPLGGRASLLSHRPPTPKSARRLELHCVEKRRAIRSTAALCY